MKKKMDATATSNPSSEGRGQQMRSRYSVQVAGVIAAAFTISALYSVISTLSGVTTRRTTWKTRACGSFMWWASGWR
jgi:hypothetical protein